MVLAHIEAPFISMLINNFQNENQTFLVCKELASNLLWPSAASACADSASGAHE